MCCLPSRSFIKRPSTALDDRRSVLPQPAGRESPTCCPCREEEASVPPPRPVWVTAGASCACRRSPSRSASRCAAAPGTSGGPGAPTGNTDAMGGMATTAGGARIATTTEVARGRVRARLRSCCWGGATELDTSCFAWKLCVHRAAWVVVNRWNEGE